MKRPLLIIAICLLLGAVVNVAVAWGCAVLLDPFVVERDDRGAERTVRGSPVDWHVWAWTRIGVKHIYSMMGSGFGVRPAPVWEDLTCVPLPGPSSSIGPAGRIPPRAAQRRRLTASGTSGLLPV